jgi:hypothetical protein
MRTSRLVIAVILALVGLVWVGQGTGIIAGSAMSGSSFWAIIGALLLIAAAAVVAMERMRSTRA